MKKVYVIKTKDSDFNEKDHDLLEEASADLDKALRLIRRAGWKIDNVKTSLKATSEDCDEALDAVEKFKNAVDSDIGFESKFGNIK